MSIWTRIREALSALALGQGLSAIFEHLRAPPERSVAFTIAVIALGAKMAKADGLVTRDEVTAFREIFHIAQKDEPGAARVFNLARQDAAGFEVYASQIRGMFAGHPQALSDLLEGLFHIALADGVYHPYEDAFLTRVAEILDLPPTEYHAMRARFVPDKDKNAYDVLGVRPDMPMDQIRTAWRQLVRDNHPDALIARGVPLEARLIAEKRIIEINRAWEEISGKVPV